ncbi:MAG: right-handed parallel beta-helix repeat-containing protein [Prevotellaceae bacterium]|jgi:hypothetical protein|nr:right-handed parallel beta-helix repeat-containing protein [Prevotellaceae bacterium]
MNTVIRFSIVFFAGLLCGDLYSQAFVPVTCIDYPNGTGATIETGQEITFGVTPQPLNATVWSPVEWTATGDVSCAEYKHYGNGLSVTVKGKSAGTLVLTPSIASAAGNGNTPYIDNTGFTVKVIGDAERPEIDGNGRIKNAYFNIIPDVNTEEVGKTNADNITKALKWCADNGFHSVRFESATYYIYGDNETISYQSDKGGIRTPSNITIDLDGATFKSVNSKSPAYSIFCIYRVNNVTVKNGRIEGDKNVHNFDMQVTPSGRNCGTHEWGYGIDIAGSADIVIDSVEIYNTTGDGILVGTHGMFVDKVGAGITTDGVISKNITVKNCNIHSNRRQGISIIGAVGATVTDCKIHNIGSKNPADIRNGTAPGAGIDLEGELDWQVKNIVIRNNVFTDNAAGAVICHRHSENVEIDGNTTNGAIGVVFGHKIIIRSNTVENSGIFVAETNRPRNVIIEDNILNMSPVKILMNIFVIVRRNTIINSIIDIQHSNAAVYNNLIKNTSPAANQYGIYLSSVFVPDIACLVPDMSNLYKVYLVNNNCEGNFTVCDINIQNKMQTVKNESLMNETLDKINAGISPEMSGFIMPPTPPCRENYWKEWEYD